MAFRILYHTLWEFPYLFVYRIEIMGYNGAMWKKRLFVSALPLLLLLGCRGPSSPAEAAPDVTEPPAPTLTAVPRQEKHEVVVAATPAPTFTPQPTPTATPTPTPEPTPEPTPTATPDPYEGQTRVSHKKDDRFFYVTLTEALKERITGISYPAPGQPCRVKYDDLRYVRILYVDFEGVEREGELMVNRRVADDVIDIFYQLYEAQYPLASVKLVDDYGEVADDNLSMADNNTSAFCYRQVTGSKKLSWHSFGAAIDVNPVQNPYINGSRVSPPEGREYLNRRDKRPHMIDRSDYCYKVFKAHGWKWGGDFSGDKDYQHFYKELSGVKR